MSSSNLWRTGASLLAFGLVVSVLGVAATAAARPARARRVWKPALHRVGKQASGGGGWSSPQNVSGSPEIDSEGPTLAVTDAGAAHLVWEEGNELYHSYRANGSWTDPDRISGTGNGEQPALAAGPENTVHLVYVNNSDIFYTSWSVSGWGIPQNLSQTTQGSDSPYIAIDSDGTIHVVAVEGPDRRLQYANVDEGTYLPIPNAYGEGPAIDVTGTETMTVRIAYRDATQPDIFTLEHASGSWSLPESVTNTPLAFSTAPDLRLDESGRGHIVWQETISATEQIQYAQGATWTPVVTLSASSVGTSLPALAIDGWSTKHVIWGDEAFPSFTILHSWRGDADGWQGPELVYEGDQRLRDVALGAGPDGLLHAAWAEGSLGEILYARRTPRRVYLPLVLMNVEE